MPMEAPASGVVVESGPVLYDDAAAEEEEEEEEEACVSAMDLMGGNGQFEQFYSMLSGGLRRSVTGWSEIRLNYEYV